MADNNQTPQQLDVEQILRTLASLAPPAPQTSDTPPPVPGPQQEHVQPQTHSHQHPPHPPQAVPQPHQPSSYHHRHVPHHSHPQSHPHPHPPAAQRPNPQQVHPASLTSAASTITAWRPGLRHLSKLTSSNPSFESTVTKLIREQARNIRDWDNGRRHLLEEQKAKRENEEAQLQILSVAGTGAFGEVKKMRTTEQEEEELKRFYEKVWRASRHMAESHEKELGKLGVPFFCVRAALVKEDSDDYQEDPEGGEDGIVTKKGLLELKRKMLNHLVELYGD